MSDMDAILDAPDQTPAADADKADGRPRFISVKTRLWTGFGLIAFCVLAWNIATIYLQPEASTPVTIVTTTDAGADPSGLRLRTERLGAAVAHHLLSGTEASETAITAELQAIDNAISALERQGVAIGDDIRQPVEKLRAMIAQLIALRGNDRDNYPAKEFIENFIRADNARMEQKLEKLLRQETTAEEFDSERYTELQTLQNRWLATIAAFYKLVSDRDEQSLAEFNARAAEFSATLESLQAQHDTLAPAQQALLDEITAQQKNIIDNIRDLAVIQLSDKWRTDAYLYDHKFTPLLDTLRDRIATLETPVGTPRTSAATAVPAQGWKIAPWLRLALVAGVLALMAGLVWLLSRSVLDGIDQARRLATNIAKGKLDTPVTIDSNDETGELLRAMATMQKKLKRDIDSREQELRKFCRLKHALNHVSASIIIAGKDHRIRYANHAAQKMFEKCQEDLATRIPNFDPANLTALDIGAFHDDAAGHVQKITGLAGPLHLEVEIGERIFDYVASPVLDANGERLGTVIEWTDRTGTVRVEQHISEVIKAARNGQLDRRLTMACENEYYALLEEQLNALLGTNEQIIQDAIRVLGAIANGDLTQTITTHYEGDYLELKNNINRTVEKLTSIIGHIRETAEVSKQNAHEIRQSNMELSVRTEQQSAAIEKTAASIEKITGIVRQNLENTQSVNALATEARDEAQDGGKVVTRTIEAMTAISESSKRISDVIHIIDEIAFQTNLLALNASVEAAHAGELGRGFAVVATEVRNLAQRSAEAAKEITELIEDSGRKVEEGAKLVDESGETLHQIIESIRKVSGIIAEISAAGEEQAAGIEQVNRAIVEIDSATQQNTAMVEETAAASEALGKQADELARLVGYFRIPEQPPTDGDEEFVERRGADRPWSDSAVVLFDEEPEPEATSPPPAAVNGGWQEF